MRETDHTDKKEKKDKDEHILFAHPEDKDKLQRRAVRENQDYQHYMNSIGAGAYFR